MNVEGKVIIITGAARGIGQEYARYLGGLGARIVVGDINDCAQYARPGEGRARHREPRPSSTSRAPPSAMDWRAPRSTPSGGSMR